MVMSENRYVVRQIVFKIKCHLYFSIEIYKGGVFQFVIYFISSFSHVGQKYRMLVIAETDSTSVNASSDGVTIIDPKNNLVNIKVHDGKLCPGEAGIKTLFS